jgi:hypothetical protein
MQLGVPRFVRCDPVEAAEVALDDVISLTVPTRLRRGWSWEKLGMTYERDVEHVGLPHVLYRLAREH